MSTDIVGPTNAPNTVTSRPADTRISFGASDSWFKDCTSALSNDGTRVMAGWLNAVIGQFRSAIRGNGATGGGAVVVTEDNSDGMLLRAIQHLIQRGQPNYAADTGTANAVVAALSPAPAELKSGLVARIKKGSVANGTGGVTLQLNAFPQKPVYRADGTALQQGDLPANMPFAAMYDLATDSYVMLNFTGGSATAPFADTSVFTSNGNVAVPFASNTITAFSSASIGANGDVSLGSGVCNIVHSGRYIINVSQSAASVSGSDPLFGLSAAYIFKNGSTSVVGVGWQSTGGATYIKEAYGSNTYTVDLVAGDWIAIGVRQVNGASATYSIACVGQMAISKVH